jgi:hypothetical protein
VHDPKPPAPAAIRAGEIVLRTVGNTNCERRQRECVRKVRYLPRERTHDFASHDYLSSILESTQSPKHSITS